MSVLKIALLGPPEVEHGDHQYQLVPWAWFLSWWFSPNASYGGVCCLRSNNWLNHRNQFYRDLYAALLWEVMNPALNAGACRQATCQPVSPGHEQTQACKRAYVLRKCLSSYLRVRGQPGALELLS